MRYFDSGLLLKLYLSEPRDQEAEQLFYSSPTPPPFTHLHGLEMRSAVRQKLGRGEIDLAESERILLALNGDLAAGIFSQPNVSWPDVFLRAEAFSAAHGASTLCRSLDTLHVALGTVLGANEFCTFDARQARMATAVGLTVIP
jgi:predicted nucleic acid-binding protein